MGWGRKALIRGDEKAGRRNGAKIRRETFLERKVTACAVQERRCERDLGGKKEKKGGWESSRMEGSGGEEGNEGLCSRARERST